MKEAPITEGIIKYINSLPRAIARKRYSSVMGITGDPDVDACVNGHTVQIEVKRPGNHPTPLQFKRLEEWSNAGATAFWVDSVDKVKDYFKRMGWDQ